MTLFILNNTGIPYGQFDAYDGELTSFKGGEVCTLVGVGPSSTDLAAKDVGDGYDNSVTKQRPVVTKAALTSTSAPLYLADDGTASTSATQAGYGTLFGVVIGATAGQASGSNGTVIGPHTALGSGKITLWKNPGLYGVSTDAVDTAAGGLIPTNSAVTVGTQLFYTSTGLLTTSANKVSGGNAVAYFIEFSTGDVLVTTNSSLTRVGTGPGKLTFRYVVIDWFGTVG